MIEIKPIDADDCAAMARDMRAADRLEMAAMAMADDTYAARLDCLIGLMRKSQGLARAGYVDGKIVVVYGVIARTILASEGHPWLLGSDMVFEPHVQRVMGRRCRRELLAVIPPHVSHLWNLVHSGNEIAVKWLKWMNFQFDAKPIQHGGLSWLLFRMEAS